MSAFIPNTREKRLVLAMLNAGVTREYVTRYTRGVQGVEQYLDDPDSFGGMRPECAIAVGEALAVSPAWLHYGEPSVAANRLVLALQLYEMTERSRDGQAFVEVPLTEYLELKARAASVPGPRLFST